MRRLERNRRWAKEIQQYPRRTAAIVRHGQVRSAVAVEIAGYDALKGCSAGTEVRSARERAATVAQKDAHGVAGMVAYRNIELAIVVEVGRC